MAEPFQPDDIHVSQMHTYAKIGSDKLTTQTKQRQQNQLQRVEPIPPPRRLIPNRRISDEATRFVSPNLGSARSSGLQSPICKPGRRAFPLRTARLSAGDHSNPAHRCQPTACFFTRPASQRHTAQPAYQLSTCNAINGAV